MPWSKKYQLKCVGCGEHMPSNHAKITPKHCQTLRWHCKTCDTPLSLHNYYDVIGLTSMSFSLAECPYDENEPVNTTVYELINDVWIRTEAEQK